MIRKINTAAQISLLFVLISCSPTVSEKTEPATNTELPSKLSSDDIIVYYNQDTLFEKSVYVSGLKKKIEGDISTLEKSLNKEKSDYETWAMQQEEWAAKGLLSQTEMEKTRAEAARKQQALMERSQRAEKSFSDMQVSVNDKLQVAIDSASKALNKDKKIKFILVYSKAMPYLHPMEGAVDITNQMASVIDELFSAKK